MNVLQNICRIIAGIVFLLSGFLKALDPVGGALKIGDRLRVGETLLEVSQIGKECHSHCEVFKQTGECIMPKKGIFTKVLRGGRVKKGDVIEYAE